MPKGPVVIIMAVLLLIATGVLVWNGGNADDAQQAARTRTKASHPGLPAGPVEAPVLPASGAAAVTAAVADASATQVGDPFKAFLEASKSGQAPVAGAAVQAASPPVAQDPFKAAFEAGRRPEPVPLVSPFGARK
jgi:hypothetical protein